MNDDDFMKMALREAELAAAEGEIPVGAVVVCEGRVIASGRNARLLSGSPFAHAEMLALERAATELKIWRLDACSMFVTLEPCPMCAGAMVQARIGRLAYGARDPKAGAAGSLYDIPRDVRLPHRCIVRSGLLASECAALLGSFFAKRRGQDRGPILPE